MSCTDCASNEILYVGDGTTVLYTFPFTYFDQSDVYVELYNFTTRRWVATTEWTFANATTVQFNTAPPAPPADDPLYANVKIARCTDIDPLAATFFPGSAIRAQDLNNNFEQLQMAIQEGRCQVPDWFFDYLDKYYWNKTDETITSTEAWISDDEHIATTAAGDQRWLNADASDVIGGAGIDVTADAGAGTIKVETDLLANGGLQTTPAGDDGELSVIDGNGITVTADGVNVGQGDGITVAADAVSVKQGAGVVVNADGVNAGITTIAVNGAADPDIVLTETLPGSVTNTEIGVIGGAGITVSASGDDITIAADSTQGVSKIIAGANISISPITGVGDVTITSTGGGGGSLEAAVVVANCVELNTAAAVPPTDDEFFLVLDSSNMTAAAGAAPGNTTAIDNLPETEATGMPIGGYGPTIQVYLQWKTTQWEFIRWDPTNPDIRYINEVDAAAPNTAGARQSIRWNGLDLYGESVSGNPVVGYEMGFAPNGSPDFSINGGGVTGGQVDETASLQLAWLDKGAVGSHGIYMSSGSRLEKNGKVEFRGVSDGSAIPSTDTIVDFNDGDGVVWKLDAGGQFETVGSVGFAQTRIGSLVDRKLLLLSAVPDENYFINFPQTSPPIGDNWILKCNIANTDPKNPTCNLDWGQATGGSEIGPIANFTAADTGQTTLAPGGLLFDNNTNRFYVSVTTEPATPGGTDTANVLVQLVP